MVIVPVMVWWYGGIGRFVVVCGGGDGGGVGIVMVMVMVITISILI